MANRNRPAPDPGGGARTAAGEDGGDQALWRQVTRDVRPLRRPPQPASPAKPAAADPPAAPPPPRPARRAVSPPTAARPPATLDLAPGVAPGIDQRTLNRLKRGLIPPETRIDLHTMTQDEAHRALVRFLAAAQAAGRRSVLIITGKGFRGEGSVGVLKTNVPRWLNEEPTRSSILAFSHASRADGGEGALYVLLRRTRPSADGRR